MRRLLSYLALMALPPVIGAVTYLQQIRPAPMWVVLTVSLLTFVVNLLTPASMVSRGDLVDVFRRHVTSQLAARGFYLHRPRPARRITDPTRLGVEERSRRRRGVRAALHTWRCRHVQAYQEREQDVAVRHALSSPDSTLLVLHGERGTGRHRMAYEAVRAVLPEARVFRPSTTAQLRRFLLRASPDRRYVLWIDRLNLTDGQTPGVLTTVLENRTNAQNTITLAILPSETLARCFLPQPADDHLRDEGLWAASELLNRPGVPLIEVPQRSAGRGVARFPDARVVADLWEQWRTGQPVAPATTTTRRGDGPAVASLVAAVTDWQRLGLRPIDEANLSFVATSYLPPCETSDVSFGTALRLARRRGLVSRSAGRRYTPNKILLDLRIDQPVPGAVWQAAVRAANGFEAADVGKAALELLCFDHAVEAFDKAVDAGKVPHARYWRALAIGESGRPLAAVSQLRALEATTADTKVRIHHAIGNYLGESGQRGSAIRELEQLLAEAPDAHDIETIGVRASLYRWQCEAGRVEPALSALAELVKECQQRQSRAALTPTTLAIRHTIAFWTAKLSRRVGEAIGRFTELIHDYEATYGERHPRTLRVRNDLARVWADNGETAKALAELRCLTSLAERQLGRANICTIAIRINQAWCLAKSGDVTAAITDYEHLVTDCERNLDADHRHTLLARREHAYWLATQPGRQADAERAFREVLVAQQRSLDDNHPETLRTARELARIRGHRTPGVGCRELSAVLARQRQVLDPDHADINHTQELLNLWQRVDQTFVARQPIFGRDRKVAGFELLFRQSQGARSAARRDTAATSQVFINTFTVFNTRELVGDLPCFINVTRDFLTGAVPIPVEPGQVVLDLPWTVRIDDAVAAGIRRLAGQGYHIALSTRIWKPICTELLEHVRYVRFDLRMPSHQAYEIAEDTGQYPHIQRIGHHLERADQLSFADDLECDLLQGHALGYPEMFSGKSLPSSPQIQFELIQLLNDATGAEMARVVTLVKRDPHLIHSVLRLGGKPTDQIDSLQEALVRLGFDKLRGLVVNRSLAEWTSNDAHLAAFMIDWCEFAERLAPRHGVFGADAYLAQLMAEISAYWDQPLSAVVSRYPLPAKLTEAVTCGAGQIGAILRAVAGYKNSVGGTPTISPEGAAGNGTVYLDAMRQSTELMSVV